jgi:hypothetical protein
VLAEIDELAKILQPMELSKTGALEYYCTERQYLNAIIQSNAIRLALPIYRWVEEACFMTRAGAEDNGFVYVHRKVRSSKVTRLGQDV